MKTRIEIFHYDLLSPSPSVGFYVARLAICSLLAALKLLQWAQTSSTAHSEVNYFLLGWLLLEREREGVVKRRFSPILLFCANVFNH